MSLIASKVRNVKEVLTLAKVVTVSIVREVVKDGFQPKDLTAFLKSPDFEAAIGPAVEDIQKVPQEVKDAGFLGGLELAKHAQTCVIDVLDAIKGK